MSPKLWVVFAVAPFTVLISPLNDTVRVCRVVFHGFTLSLGSVESRILV